MEYKNNLIVLSIVAIVAIVSIITLAGKSTIYNQNVNSIGQASIRQQHTVLSIDNTRNGIIFTLDASNGLTGMYRSGTGNPIPWVRTECVGSGYPIRAGNCSYVYNLSRFGSPIKPLDSNYPLYSGNSSYRTMGILRNSETLPWIDNGNAQVPYVMEFGTYYWFGMSVFIPSNWINEVPGRDTLIFQTQSFPDAGESYRSPVFSIEVDSDHWQYRTRYDNRSISPANNAFVGSTKTNIGSINPSKGRWTDFVWRIKYGYNNTGTGVGELKLWKDGLLVADVSTGIGSNDILGPYPSMGIYNWFWSPVSLNGYPGPFNRDKTELYIDEFRVGSSTSSYADVAPGITQSIGPVNDQ